LRADCCEDYFEHRGDKTAGGKRKLLSEELHNLRSPPDVIRMLKSTSELVRSELVACIEGNRNVEKVLVWKT
jgi:hypothetical protein